MDLKPQISNVRKNVRVQFDSRHPRHLSGTEKDMQGKTIKHVKSLEATSASPAASNRISPKKAKFLIGSGQPSDCPVLGVMTGYNPMHWRPLVLRTSGSSRSELSRGKGRGSAPARSPFPDRGKPAMIADPEGERDSLVLAQGGASRCRSRSTPTPPGAQAQGPGRAVAQDRFTT